MKKGTKDSFSKQDGKKRILILSVIIILVLLTAYLNFLYYPECNDSVCFNTNLVNCKKSVFTNVQEDSTWFYTIKGSSKGKCVIAVRNIDMQIEETDNVRNKEMICYLPKGMVMSPESDIDLCHGLLKEALQDIIIKQLHIYIVQNIGQIQESMIG